MKIVLQRVKEASVVIEGKKVSKIGRGVCLLVGVERGDESDVVEYLAKKVAELRVFPDDEGKMNLSLQDIGGEVLAVSQFTLAASVKKGRRPGFDKAEEPERAEALFDKLLSELEKNGLPVKTGRFGQLMEVHLINDGPVTFILEKKIPNLPF